MRIEITLPAPGLNDHSPVDFYTDNEDEQFTWQVGMAGELIIYYKTKHRVLSATTDEGIRRVYAAGQWLKVDVS